MIWFAILLGTVAGKLYDPLAWAAMAAAFSVYQDKSSTEDEFDKVDFKRARALLNQTGLSLLKPNGRERPEYELFVPNQNPELWNLFNGTDWAGDRGAGVWAGALRQAPLDKIRGDVNCRISGAQGKGVAIPLNVAIADNMTAEQMFEAVKDV